MITSFVLHLNESTNFCCKIILLHNDYWRRKDELGNKGKLGIWRKEEEEEVFMQRNFSVLHIEILLQLMKGTSLFIDWDCLYTKQSQINLTNSAEIINKTKSKILSTFRQLYNLTHITFRQQHTMLIFYSCTHKYRIARSVQEIKVYEEIKPLLFL